MMRRLIILFLTLFVLNNCHSPDSKNSLIIGTIAGPETELAKIAQKIAKQNYNLNVKIMEFNDYNLPNEALNDGSLDANIYQHLPYLQEAIKARNFNFTVIGKTFIYPMGIYSNKIKDIKDLPNHALVAIPNDPSNESRALLLLEKAGLIKLANHDLLSRLIIKDNPKNLNIKPLDAAQLPRVLPDVDIALINTNYAIPAKLNPDKDAIFLEDKDSPYANLIVIKTNSSKKAQLLKFVHAMHDLEIVKKSQELFQGSAVPAW